MIDGNNLAYRCFITMYESTGQLRTNTGVPTTVSYGLLRMINAFVESFSVDKCIICWDGGSKYRKKIFKYYKYHRKKADWADDYYEEINTARDYYSKLGILQAQVRGIEADDIIGFMTARFRELKKKVIIFSDDKDFFQLAPYNVRIYRPTKMEMIDKVEMENRFGFPPKLLPKVVAFTGEQKDNIPGTGNLNDETHEMTKIGIGPKTALKFLVKPEGGYYNVSRAIKNFDTSNRFYDAVKANKRQILKSYKLSRIRTKDSWYADWELDALDNLYTKAILPATVKKSMVRNIREYLEFKSVNLIKVLGNLGVKVK